MNNILENISKIAEGALELLLEDEIMPEEATPLLKILDRICIDNCLRLPKGAISLNDELGKPIDLS